MQQLLTRAYNRFEIDNARGIIRKLSNTARLKDEMQYYVKLSNAHPKESILFPRLVDWSDEEETYWMELELYDYANLGVYKLSQSPQITWKDVFTKLKTILQNWSTIHPYSYWKDDEIAQTAYDMYIEKTEREQLAFYNGWNDKIEGIFSSDGSTELFINSISYRPFEIVWPEIKSYIETNMLKFTPALIHGDFCFSNILYGPEKSIFRFIDPRGSFGKAGVYGDTRYDVAKLYHSVDGLYESFITDNFTVKSQDISHELVFNTSNDSDILHAFENVFFSDFYKKEIKILQGCIFIGMCARHYDSIARQHAMYLTGIRLLNEAAEL